MNELQSPRQHTGWNKENRARRQCLVICRTVNKTFVNSWLVRGEQRYLSEQQVVVSTRFRFDVMKLQLEPLCEHLLEHLFFGKPINTNNWRRAAEFEPRSALRRQHEKIGGPSVAHSFVANNTGHVITNVVLVVQLPSGTEMIDDGC